jgi:sodium/potassium/calcium exchanger 6
LSVSYHFCHRQKKKTKKKKEILTFFFVVNEFIEARQIIIGVGIGCTLCLVVLATTQSKEPPSWFWLLSFAGFFVSLNWIFLLANAMVGLLQVKSESNR